MTTPDPSRIQPGRASSIVRLSDQNADMAEGTARRMRHADPSKGPLAR